MKVIKAKFIGTDSLGYKHNQYYTIVLCQVSLMTWLFNGWQIEIRRVDDSRVFCPYKNMETFLQNWDDIQII